jgi:membrane protein implicated in regulation of membrane protease activity
MDAFTIYLICFGAGLVFTIVSAFMADVSGGHDVQHDGLDGHGGDFGVGHGMPDFSPLSPTVIASFVTAFGGLGMVFSKIEMTSALWLSVPLALIGALAVAAVVLALFRSIFRATQGSSEARVSQLVGASATVISPIPAASVGEIAYVQSGSRYTAPAREEDGAALAAGQTVIITRIVGTQFYVRAAAYLP